MTPHIDPWAPAAEVPAAASLNERMHIWRAAAQPRLRPPAVFWAMWGVAFLPDAAALLLGAWLSLAPETSTIPAPDDALPAPLLEIRFM